jgi:hypothetical protein
MNGCLRKMKFFFLKIELKKEKNAYIFISGKKCRVKSKGQRIIDKKRGP